MRYMVVSGVMALVLAGCTPPVPDTGAGQGAGFESYSDYLARRSAEQRRAELQGRVAVLPPKREGEASGEAATGLPASGQAPAPAGTPLSPENPDNVGLSDEQDFEAVTQRETIESDKERLARQRAQYKVIAPSALPSRPGSVGPNIVEYALSTTNDVGEPLYRRSALFAKSRYQRNCAKYPSPDQAQMDFLRRGGPKRDPLGLDPDGDGFACTWDPRPFRMVKARR